LRHKRGAKSHHFTPSERRATWSLALIISSRMLGLFMIFPILSLYIPPSKISVAFELMPGAVSEAVWGSLTGHESILGATPTTVGIAIGIYGLTQGLLQIPFGLISDRFGRKPVIVLGLLLFIFGSMVAAMSTSIWGVIIGRVIQGGGAVAAVIMALTADLTREETRTKALAIIGMTIGLGIMVALIIGPILDRWIGIFNIFWITAALATFGLLLILFVVPTPKRIEIHRDAETVPRQMKRVLSNAQLMRFNGGIFILHAIFAASFLVFPLLIKDITGLEREHHGWLYLPVLAASLLLMGPLMIIGERFRKMKQVFLFAIIALVVAEISFRQLHLDTFTLVATLILFFGVFNFLEAALPSLISKTSSPEDKGTAMGVFSSSQYFGTFAGGVLGGIVLDYFGFPGVFLLCTVLLGVWLLFAVSMKHPRYLVTRTLRVGPVTESEAKKLIIQLTSVQGVAEAILEPDEEVAYLKVDQKALDEEALEQYSIEPAEET
jgi:MFS family permease